MDAELLTPGQIRSLVSWTRAFHEAVAGFEHPGPWRSPAEPRATLVGHNDIAPYNACFDGDELAGVFDCDAYGDVATVDVADAVPRRTQAMLDWIPRGAADGDPGMRRLLALGEPERSQQALDALVPRLRRIRPLLA